MYRHVYVSDVPVILYSNDTIENKFRLPKLIPLLENIDKRSQNEGFLSQVGQWCVEEELLGGLHY